MNQGFIYIIESEQNQIKIGRSIKPEVRIRTIETSSGQKIINSFISKKYPSFYFIERAVHKHFAKDRKIGEWFSTPFAKAVNYLKSEQWMTQEYFNLVEEEKNQKGPDIDWFFDEFYKTDELCKSVASAQPSYEDDVPVHCSLCRCPIDIYKPLHTYDGNACPLLYDYADVRDEIFEGKKSILKADFFSQCKKLLPTIRPDVPNLSAVIEELIEIDVDLGELDLIEDRLVIPATQAISSVRAIA